MRVPREVERTDVRGVLSLDDVARAVTEHRRDGRLLAEEQLRVERRMELTPQIETVLVQQVVDRGRHENLHAVRMFVSHDI